MTKKQKLELTWIGKENRARLEPRILLEDPEKSCHARHRVTKNDRFDNRLIHGDNLLALKALEQEYADKIKCVSLISPTKLAAHSAFAALARSIQCGFLFCATDLKCVYAIAPLLCFETN